MVCGRGYWICKVEHRQAALQQKVISSIHSWSWTNTEERNCKFAIQVVSSRKVIGGGSGGLPYWRRVISLSTWLDLEAYWRRRRRRLTAAVPGSSIAASVIRGHSTEYIRWERIYQNMASSCWEHTLLWLKSQLPHTRVLIIVIKLLANYFSSSSV